MNKIIKVGCSVVICILVVSVICLFVDGYSKKHVEKFTDGLTDPLDSTVNYSNLLTSGFIVPPYIIIAYAGTAPKIPTGWALCNGQNGTPDLRNKFIYGTEHPFQSTIEVEVSGKGTKTVKVRRTGGKSNVTLRANNLPEHTHTGRTSEDGNHGHNHSCASDDGGGNDNHYAMGDNNSSRGCDLDRAGDHRHSFTTAVNTTTNSSFSILPSYYKLAYIMKLPN